MILILTDYLNLMQQVGLEKRIFWGLNVRQHQVHVDNKQKEEEYMNKFYLFTQHLSYWLCKKSINIDIYMYDKFLSNKYD